MGKRSNFKRSKGDYYITPPSAVLPLVPYLETDTFFFEPCAGNGALIEALKVHGHMCVGSMDLEPKCDLIPVGDALALSSKDFDPNCSVEAIITNPPWTRAIMHPMIERFSAIAPTWLLFDADWMHTKQAAPFLEYCHKIVSVGRVSWMGNGVSGKDNAAWYLFDQTSNEVAQRQFIGRAA